MVDRPRWKPHLTVEVACGEGVFLLSERGHRVLVGRLYELVAPLIDGRRTRDEIVDRLAAAATAVEVYYALELLERGGYLARGGAHLDEPAAAFFSLQGGDAAEALGRLAAAGVSLEAVGAVAGAALSGMEAALAAAGVRVAGDGPLGVVLTDDYLRPELEGHNREALRRGRPWLLVRPTGMTVWVGPLFLPGRSACWECLSARLRRHRFVERFLSDKTGRREPWPVARSAPAFTVQLALQAATTEIARFLGGGTAPLGGRVLTIDTSTWESAAHLVVRRPQCAACGDPAARAPRVFAPPSLEPREKLFLGDGGHRALPPAETLRAYRHHISPISGLLAHLTRDEDTSGETHVYVAGDNAAARREHLLQLEQSLRSVSAGKGTSDLEAQVSGLCEAIERYSGLCQGDEPVVQGTLEELGAAAIHPNDCMLYSDRQYRERDRWNARASAFNRVPEPFEPDRPVAWSPVWSLTRGEVRYLPRSYCYYEGEPLSPGEPVFCRADSNGTASGNTLEEAILQGLLELVERDSVALWWYGRSARPEVLLDGAGDAGAPYLERMRDHYRRIGRELWFLDLTADLEIPAFAAVSRRREGAEEIVFGFGCHLDPRVALLRAGAELNQVCSASSRLAREADLGGVDGDLLGWLRMATLAEQPYLAPDPEARARSVGELLGAPPRWSDDLLEDVRRCQAILARRGMEVLVLDQTRPDVGLPVVRVIVPGLRHFWARFAPGRLYDVPVRLGLCRTPLLEEDLNPIPMFI